MFAHVSRPGKRRWLVALLLAAVAGHAPLARAAITSYSATLTGSGALPPTGSPGAAAATVDLDPAANTMRVHVVFGGLIGVVTACHIHAPTAVPGSGTADVATPTPTFPGFPGGVKSGTYDRTFDMTLESSYNPTFVDDFGGTAADAEAALFQAIANGCAYLNLHTSAYPNGEITGFLHPQDPTSTMEGTWGRLKALYR